MVTRGDKIINTISLTDCLHFINGYCMFKSACRYRHCQAAAKQLEKCPRWPKSCRDMDCPLRHPSGPTKLPTALPKETELVSFFWDIENVPIPKGQRPFEIVQRIRQKFIIESGLQEGDFSCYCNINIISQENQQNLHHANVRIIHIPDRKPGAADRQIMLELDRFERAHRPPATIVLISGDIDFVGKLSDLRHQAGFHMIVIHNKPAKEELKATVNAHYPWELFTEPTQQQQPPLVRDDSEQLINPSKHYRPVLNNRPDSINNKNEPKLPKLMDLPITLEPDLDNRNNVNQHDISQPNPSPLYRRPPIGNRINHQTDTIQSKPPPTPQRMKPKAMLNPENTPPPVSTSIVAPGARLRRATSNNQLNRQNSSASSNSNEQTSQPIIDDAEKQKPKSFHCPFCTNEFSTVQAIRQHQKDKNHLYDCPDCKETFPTSNGLMQHQTAKGHNASKNIGDQSNSQFDTANNLNIHQHPVDLQPKINTVNTNSHVLSAQSPPAKYSAIHRKTNNVNPFNDDDD